MSITSLSHGRDVEDNPGPGLAGLAKVRLSAAYPPQPSDRQDQPTGRNHRAIITVTQNTREMDLVI